MQFKNLAVSAFVASALAAPQAGSSSANLVSIYQVLQTALPSSLVAEAMTNPAAASSEIAAEFSTATPTWFTALPTDIQTYLVPLATGGSIAGANVTSAAGAANGTGIVTSAIVNSTAISAGQSSILASGAMQNSSVVAGATTGTSKAGTSASATGASASRSASGSAGASSSSAAGAIPTAVAGMGLAGVVGIVGLFAL